MRVGWLLIKNQTRPECSFLSFCSRLIWCRWILRGFPPVFRSGLNHGRAKPYSMYNPRLNKPLVLAHTLVGFLWLIRYGCPYCFDFIFLFWLGLPPPHQPPPLLPLSLSWCISLVWLGCRVSYFWIFKKLLLNKSRYLHIPELGLCGWSDQVGHIALNPITIKLLSCVVDLVRYPHHNPLNPFCRALLFLPLFSLVCVGVANGLGRVIFRLSHIPLTHTLSVYSGLV